MKSLIQFLHAVFFFVKSLKSRDGERRAAQQHMHGWYVLTFLLESVVSNQFPHSFRFESSMAVPERTIVQLFISRSWDSCRCDRSRAFRHRLLRSQGQSWQDFPYRVAGSSISQHEGICLCPLRTFQSILQSEKQHLETLTSRILSS